MSQPKNHHVVPRMLLRHFAKEGWLNRYRMDGETLDKTGRVSVKRATTVENLNQLDGWDVEHIRLESIFGKVEDAAASALAPLRRNVGGAWPLDDQARNAVCRWLALSQFRSPERRAAWERAITAYLAREDRSLHLADLIGSGVVTGEPEILAQLQKVRGIPSPTGNHPRNVHLGVLEDHWQALSRRIFCMQWILVRTEEPRFFTSDSPFVLTTQQVAPQHFETLRVTEIDYQNAKFGYLALGRSLGLIVREPPSPYQGPLEDVEMPANAGTVNGIQLATLLGAEQFLFQHPDDSIVEGL